MGAGIEGGVNSNGAPPSGWVFRRRWRLGSQARPTRIGSSQQPLEVGSVFGADNLVGGRRPRLPLHDLGSPERLVLSLPKDPLRVL